MQQTCLVCASGRAYNNTVIAFCRLYVELVLQQEASGGHRISKTKKNLSKKSKCITNGKEVMAVSIDMDSIIMKKDGISVDCPESEAKNMSKIQDPSQFNLKITPLS